MSLHFLLEYWRDGDWFVGRVRQVPGVFSQGTTLEELEENIRDAYRMMLAGQETAPIEAEVASKEIEILAWSGASSFANWSEPVASS